MLLFKDTKSSLAELNEKPFKLEKEIQKLFEKNLKAITGLLLVKSEFTIKSNRIDTLAYDADSQAFVIIEYKRSQNYSVVDQGVSYLNLMLEYKAEFIVEYNETQNKALKRSDVDWTQLTLWQFDCEDKQIGVVQATSYDKLGNVLSSLNFKSYEIEMTYVNPDSLGEAYLRAFCQRD